MPVCLRVLLCEMDRFFFLFRRFVSYPAVLSRRAPIVKILLSLLLVKASYCTITLTFMRLYELVLVLNPALDEKSRKKIIDDVKSWMKDVKVASEEEWGQKPLAYKIKRQMAGFYHFMKLETENVIPGDFEKRILNTDDVLRHLLVRTK